MADLEQRRADSESLERYRAKLRGPDMEPDGLVIGAVTTVVDGQKVIVPKRMTPREAGLPMAPPGMYGAAPFPSPCDGHTCR